VRERLGTTLQHAEAIVYALLAGLLLLTALGALAATATGLWRAAESWQIASETPHLLDQMLAVLMIVEILNTVRISIRSHILVIEPFLVVGLIASIRRILVITLEVARLASEGRWSNAGVSALFHASMVELGLLGALILVLVFAIALLRRYAPAPASADV
jgi:uncharacterized membrane protein (DUF373 family)